MQVGSCKVQVGSCKVQVGSCELRVDNCELRVDKLLKLKARSKLKHGEGLFYLFLLLLATNYSITFCQFKVTVQAMETQNLHK